jgi:hypothetical protein
MYFLRKSHASLLKCICPPFSRSPFPRPNALSRASPPPLRSVSRFPPPILCVREP